MISAVLVDDEEKSIRNLELLIQSECPEVKVVGSARNALEAVRQIISLQPEVVFLDVNMPGYSGFDVLESIREVDPIVIFTTAHKEYAISALRKGAFDYLLKPIDTEELKTCIERVLETKREKESADPDAGKGLVEIAVKDGIIFIRTSSLIRLEASGSYTEFYLENNVKHVASRSLKEYEAQLDNTFFRCHNSHIINLRKVVRYIHSNGHFVELSNGSTIEIARRLKDVFLERLKQVKH